MLCEPYRQGIIFKEVDYLVSQECRHDTGRVYIVLVNWNGWRNTIECLESLLRTQDVDFTVVVCDNGSKDHSIERIKDWAEGRLDVPSEGCSVIQDLVNPPILKPISYLEEGDSAIIDSAKIDIESVSLIIIRSESNLGFAGGCNLGIQYALKQDNCSYVWLLNNDTVVTPGALAELVGRMKEDQSIGLCGSTLLYYHMPDKVQALGGATFNRWLATSKHLGAFQPARTPIDQAAIERQLSYIIGASMLVSRSFLADIGFMSESYFLFFEEVDWATRSSTKYRLGYASRSIVYHKEGGSIGTKTSSTQNSLMADLFNIRNRIHFTKKYHPIALPILYLSFVGVMLNRVRRRQWDRVKAIFELVVNQGMTVEELMSKVQ